MSAAVIAVSDESFARFGDDGIDRTCRQSASGRYADRDHLHAAESIASRIPAMAMAG
jgi:hypothetical protein